MPEDRPQAEVTPSGDVHGRPPQLGSENNKTSRMSQISSEVGVSMMSG